VDYSKFWEPTLHVFLFFFLTMYLSDLV
jgi:hypothetical protein